MGKNLLPSNIKENRVFIAGGYAIYCSSMLWAVGIAERLASQHKKAEKGCRLWGRVIFRNETFYWIRFPFLRNPVAYEEGQKTRSAGDQPALF